MTIENPLLSYLYLLRELLALIGMPGACVLREDDCTTAGTPYQKARAWFSTCWGIASTIAIVCQHPLPHPERLEGQKTSRSAIYPFELATKYVEGLISELQNTGSLTNETVVASAKLHLEYQKKNDTLLPFTGPFEAWVEIGQSKIAQVRHADVYQGEGQGNRGVRRQVVRGRPAEVLHGGRLR